MYSAMVIQVPPVPIQPKICGPPTFFDRQITKTWLGTCTLNLVVYFSKFTTDIRSCSFVLLMQCLDESPSGPYIVCGSGFFVVVFLHGSLFHF